METNSIEGEDQKFYARTFCENQTKGFQCMSRNLNQSELVIYVCVCRLPKQSHITKSKVKFVLATCSIRILREININFAKSFQASLEQTEYIVHGEIGK